MVPVRGSTITRRLSAGVAAVCLLASVSPKPVSADPAPSGDAKKQLESKKQELEAIRSREQGLTKDVGALADERARLNQDLIRAAKVVQESEATLSAVEDQLGLLEQQETGIRSSIKDRHMAIEQLLAAMQRMGRQPPPALITRRDDSLKTVRSAMLLANIFPQLRYQAGNLSKELEELVRVETATREEHENASRQTARLAEDRARIDALLNRKQKSLDSGEAELARLRNQAERQAQTVASLEDLIKRQDEEIAKIERARLEAEKDAARERMRQLALAVPAGETVVELKPGTKVAFVSPDRMKPALPFEKARGALAMPASGKTLRRFGENDDDGQPAKGQSIEARGGGRITSPADGWVVYAGPFRSYGQLLIINAGGGYHILLAGMKKIDVAPGQFVLAGEPVAVIGSAESSGDHGNGSPRPVLYIEFRKDGRSIDPGPWWAENSEKVQG